MTRHRRAPAGDCPCLEERVSELERRIRIYSQLWRHGHGGQCQVWNDIALLLGPEQGRRALQALERYWAILFMDSRTDRADVCLCGAATAAALIVGRIALGDGRVAARLCLVVAPEAAVDKVLASASTVARCFLEGGADAEIPRGAEETAPAHRTAAASVDPRITHRYPGKVLRH